MANDAGDKPSGKDFESIASQWSLAGPMGDYPGLRHFFGAYLNEDFSEEGGDWRAAADTFKAEDAQLVPEVRADLQRLIDASLTEAELHDVLLELNCGYRADPTAGGLRLWLTQLDEYLTKP